MKGTVEKKKIALGGLATLFSEEDRTSVFLVDMTGNAYTFFKYKAKLIDIVALNIAVSINSKSKQDAIEEIRVGLTYGIKSGQSVIFHIGEQDGNLTNELLKGSKFWDPKQLFRPPGKIDDQWYRANLMKETDKDMFGNQGTLFPSDKFRTFISVSKDIEFSDIKWLQGLQEYFVGYKIE